MSSETDSGTPNVKSVLVTNIMVTIPDTTPYSMQLGATHQLINMDMTTVMTGVNSACKDLSIAPALLPFGLLETFTITSPDTPGQVQYCILLSKETGQRQSAWVPFGTPIHVCDHTVAVDDDARHSDISVVKTATKHDMRFRMMAGAAVANIKVLFQGVVPATLNITYHGANAIPSEMSLEAAVLASKERRRIPLLLPIIPPHVRLSGAVRRMHEAE
jgi:hypothetical protein